MADLAFIPQSQSEYAFAPGEQDEAAQSEQRNQSIQAAFDAQRFQRGMAQNLSKALSSQAADIARLKQQKEN
jgi:hypothetical protein